ncbi:hypothetical protein [Paracoccus xiamenensis]|uniref:hypothetical protein n=1 Tax=Paracoccus xiamenensis TaxID=2714901 RepID=UPI001F39D40C|nr:hypothetical protein [Paracoccus xiamenensis]
MARPGAVFQRLGDDQPASPVRGVGAQGFGEKQGLAFQTASLSDNQNVEGGRLGFVFIVWIGSFSADFRRSGRGIDEIFRIFVRFSGLARLGRRILARPARFSCCLRSFRRLGLASCTIGGILGASCGLFGVGQAGLFGIVHACGQIKMVFPGLAVLFARKNRQAPTNRAKQHRGVTPLR